MPIVLDKACALIPRSIDECRHAPLNGVGVSKLCVAAVVKVTAVVVLNEVVLTGDQQASEVEQE